MGIVCCQSFPDMLSSRPMREKKQKSRHVATIDFSKLPTEQPNPRSKKIHQLSIPEILSVMNKEDEGVPKAIRSVKPRIAKAVKMIVRSLKNRGRLFFAGAGTSGRLGFMEAAECPPTFNTPPLLVQAVMAGGRRAVFRSKEGAEDRREEALRIFQKKLRANDVLVGIAASGVTPFVQGALAAAKEKNAATILIACNTDSPLRGLVDCLIAPKTGSEIITGSTRLKAGTAAKLILNMLTVTSMIQLGKVYQNWMIDLQPKSKKLYARALRIIQEIGSVSNQEAEHYLGRAKKNVKVAIVMAKKKLDYQKASQKLKETSGFLEKALAQ